MDGLNTQNSNDSAEDICLFEIDVNKLCSSGFDVLDGFSDMADFQFGRQAHAAVETVSIKGHFSTRVSRFHLQSKHTLSIGR